MLTDMKANFTENLAGFDRPTANSRRMALERFDSEGGDQPQAEHLATKPRSKIRIRDQDAELGDGSVVIAAITSCTNTSNPAVMLGAGLLARKRGHRRA